MIELKQEVVYDAYCLLENYLLACLQLFQVYLIFSKPRGCDAINIVGTDWLMWSICDVSCEEFTDTRLSTSGALLYFQNHYYNVINIAELC